MIKIIVLAFFLLILFFAVNKVSSFLVIDKTSYETPLNYAVPFRFQILPWLNFDGRNYLEIAINGYPQSGKLLAFFPAYPVIISFLVSLTAINPILAGLALSLIFSIVAFKLFFNLTREKYGHLVAQKALTAFILFPSSFFLFAYYPESLFLCLTLGTFAFLERKKYYFAAILVSLACLTRLMGVALIPVIIYEAILFYKKRGKLPWFAPLSFVGIFSAGFIFYKLTHNPLAILQAQTNSSFGRSLELFNPLIAIWNNFAKVLQGPLSSYDNPYIYPIITLELFWAIFLIVIIILSFKTLPKSYWIYLLSSSLLIFMSGVLSANVRQMLVMFPIFMFLGLKLGKTAFLVWIFLSVALLLFSSTVFLRGYWIA